MKNVASTNEDNITKRPTKYLAIEYDVTTYQINKRVISEDGIYSQPLVWNIPTPEEARLILDQINIDGAKAYKETEFYYDDKEAQERRLSALVDMGIMTCIDPALLTSN